MNKTVDFHTKKRQTIQFSFTCDEIYAEKVTKEWKIESPILCRYSERPVIMLLKGLNYVSSAFTQIKC